MFYRIDGIGEFDFGNLSSARFFALAERLVCYAGSVRAAMIAELAEQTEGEDTAETQPEVDPDDQLAASLNMEAL